MQFLLIVFDLDYYNNELQKTCTERFLDVYREQKIKSSLSNVESIFLHKSQFQQYLIFLYCLNLNLPGMIAKPHLWKKIKNSQENGHFCPKKWSRQAPIFDLTWHE